MSLSGRKRQRAVSLAPVPSVDKLKDPAFIDNIRTGMARKATAQKDMVREAARDAVADTKKAERRGVYPAGEAVDPLRHLVYEQVVPPALSLLTTGSAGVTRTQDGTHVSHRVGDAGKTADCPLNYLHQRVAKANRISDIQYAAAVRYREFTSALSKVSSNTASTINHIMMAPTLTPEDRWRKLHDVSLNQTISCRDDTRSFHDRGDAMINAIFRIKRVDEKLDLWERTILGDLLVRERTIGMIASGWGLAPEAVAVLVRLALWKLVSVMEKVDREFQDWLAVERQVTGEARGAMV